MVFKGLNKMKAERKKEDKTPSICLRLSQRRVFAWSVYLVLSGGEGLGAGVVVAARVRVRGAGVRGQQPRARIAAPTAAALRPEQNRALVQEQLLAPLLPRHHSLVTLFWLPTNTMRETCAYG
jgi:hypothetical protein